MRPLTVILWGGQSWPQPAFSRLRPLEEALAGHWASGSGEAQFKNISASECLFKTKLSGIWQQCHSPQRDDRASKDHVGTLLVDLHAGFNAAVRISDANR